MRSNPTLLMVLALAALGLAACGAAISAPQSPTLVVYSGRSESLVGPLIERFEQETGIAVEVRWGETAELAATLLEEGANSPADVFFAQDPGGLGAVIDLLSPLPAGVLDRVDPRFRDPRGRWVGLSGRARVVVYNTEKLAAQDLPNDIWEFTDPRWRGRLGWAPTNASFQTMVTGMRVTWGEEKTRQWLEGMLTNNPIVYDKNTPIVAAVGVGEIEIGFVNHYYLLRFLAEEGETFPARNHFLPGGGPGSLVMVAGAGILSTSGQSSAARQFLEYLLSPGAQEYFASETFEYPLLEGVEPPSGLVPLAELNALQIDLADLADLKSTVDLLRQVGALP